MKDISEVKPRDCYNTPEHVFRQLDEVFSFTLDAACDSTNVKCPAGFMLDFGQDGLAESWAGHRVFCNPPFSTKADWIDKAVREVEEGGCHVVAMILPLNCMSAGAFHQKVIGGGVLLRDPSRANSISGQRL